MGAPERLLVAALSLLTAAVSLEGFSGVYFDNGLGQTAIEYLDITDQELMREEILTLLGLTHVPEKAAPHFIPDTSNHTVPLFMMNIYKSLTEDDGQSAGVLKNLLEEPDMDKLLNNPFKITAGDVKVINQSDIIMSFANRGHQEELQWTQLFWFDTNELPDSDDEDVIAAELRMYKQGAKMDSSSETSFNLKVFQLVEGSTGPSQLLDSRQIEFEEEGWLVLDVTRAVRLWQKDYRTNQGLMVEITEIGTGHQIHPVAAGLASSRKPVAQDKESFMVSYFKSTDDIVRRRYRNNNRKRKEKGGSGGRSKREASRRRNKKKFSNLEGDFSFHDNSNNVFRDYYGGRQRFRGCQKRVLRVSFRDLNWQDWIIAPDGYEAYYCHGECSFPLNSHMNATNHAIVQTLVHLMKPEDVPKPCCAPTKLSGISVLYFDESSNVILKKYRNMVVKACGCH